MAAGLVAVWPTRLRMVASSAHPVLVVASGCAEWIARAVTTLVSSDKPEQSMTPS